MGDLIYFSAPAIEFSDNAGSFCIIELQIFQKSFCNASLACKGEEKAKTRMRNLLFHGKSQ